MTCPVILLICFWIISEKGCLFPDSSEVFLLKFSMLQQEVVVVGDVIFRQHYRLVVIFEGTKSLSPHMCNSLNSLVKTNEKIATDLPATRFEAIDAGLQ